MKHNPRPPFRVVANPFEGRGSWVFMVFRNLVFLAGIAVALAAQEPPAPQTDEPKPDAKPVRASSLGVPFVDVPGVPVSFAVWETRVSDFATFVRETGYTWNYKLHFAQTGDHPVVNVSYTDAIAFCNWLTKREQDSGAITTQQSYRLPTKKEWDGAVGLASGRKSVLLSADREADKQLFPWGMEWPPPPQAGNFNSVEIEGHDDGYRFTSPVGKFAPSAEGVCDLAGNVWEWTSRQETGGKMTGMLRGGSWMYFRKECLLSGYEYLVPPELHAPSVGFRCVFEDKRRVQEFMLASQDTSDDRERKLREMLGSGPKASKEDIERLRRELADKPAPRPAGPALPDVKTLSPARAGASFTNSLGMLLLPLSNQGRMLMGAQEVRVQDYEAAMVAQGRTWDRKPAFSIAASHPIVNVSWEEALAFCDWLTTKDRASGIIKEGDRYRLPSDLEWSKAVGLDEADGGTPETRHLSDKATFPWGKESAPPQRTGNFDSARMNDYQDNFTHTAPVGSFPPNKAGFHDLAGNVEEWCADPWPSAPVERVIRGSSWLTSDSGAFLSSARQHLPASSTRSDLGFRVVLELAQP